MRSRTPNAQARAREHLQNYLPRSTNLAKRAARGALSSLSADSEFAAHLFYVCFDEFVP